MLWFLLVNFNIFENRKTTQLHENILPHPFAFVDSFVV